MCSCLQTISKISWADYYALLVNVELGAMLIPACANGVSNSLIVHYLPLDGN